jgi:gliding motility-associated lipoprotein GldD
MRLLLTFFSIVVCILTTSCSKDYQPKPKGYNRIPLPDTVYRSLPDTLPYQFEYSKYATLAKDTSWIRETHWVEIHYPTLKATIHVTYKELRNSEQLLKEFLNDSYVLTAKHQIKANAINETIVTTKDRKVAVIAEIEGEVPSQFQFTMTDSSRNFLRGALYFNTQVANDSLKPAIDFMKKEMMHIVNTLKFKK